MDVYRFIDSQLARYFTGECGIKDLPIDVFASEYDIFYSVLADGLSNCGEYFKQRMAGPSVPIPHNLKVLADFHYRFDNLFYIVSVKANQVKLYEEPPNLDDA